MLSEGEHSSSMFPLSDSSKALSVTLLVGCKPIKLLFFFTVTEGFLSGFHSVSSLSGAFWGRVGLAQPALPGGLFGFGQRLLAAHDLAARSLGERLSLLCACDPSR